MADLVPSVEWLGSVAAAHEVHGHSGVGVIAAARYHRVTATGHVSISHIIGVATVTNGDQSTTNGNRHPS